MITAIEHYLENNSTASTNKTSPKPGSELYTLAPEFDPTEASLPLVGQSSSLDLNSLLLNRLTLSLETRLQETILTLVKRISFLESHLLQQADIGDHLGSNSEAFRQQGQLQDLHLTNLKKDNSSLDVDFKNGHRTAPSNGTPPQKPSQAPKAQVASNNPPNDSLTDHVGSSLTLVRGARPELNVASNSLQEHPHPEVDADANGLHPKQPMSTPEAGDNICSTTRCRATSPPFASR